MKTLFKNGQILNVFTGALEKINLLVEDDMIIGLDNYDDNEADWITDVSGKILCPGFIDSHIHIESSMLIPNEFCKLSIAHGTTAIIADPHEIANVNGRIGINFMLQASEGLPMDIFFMVPSCVPATCFDESGATLEAADIAPFYNEKRVLGLAEFMNYPGVIFKDEHALAKINDAKDKNVIINGHAPLLSGKDLDKYISAGITDDHECSSEPEAKERIRKGQWVMIRQGTAAKDLKGLINLFDAPWSSKCMLATDDKHPADLIANGHIDSIIREAVSMGKSAITGIQMATINAATYYGLRHRGALAPGYKADFIILNDLDTIDVKDVYQNGKLVVSNKQTIPFEKPRVQDEIWRAVRNSFYMEDVKASDFEIKPISGLCRIIEVNKGSLITEELHEKLNFNSCNGIDLKKDILKLAVIERHMGTGHIGKGFIKGIGLKEGAIASSVAHDSHNLIVIGTNNNDMAVVANRVKAMGGGLAVAKDGEIIAELPLPMGGLMNSHSAQSIAEMNENIRKKASELGSKEGIEPFMNMAFVSLPVIPHLKMTTKGLVDVDKFELVSLEL